jgi:hypothetical protein
MAEPGVARRNGSAMLLYVQLHSHRSANSPGVGLVLEPRPTKFAGSLVLKPLQLPALLVGPRAPPGVDSPAIAQ